MELIFGRFDIHPTGIIWGGRRCFQTNTESSSCRKQQSSMHTHWSWQGNARHRGNQQDKNPIENLKAIGCLTHNATSIEILEFGLTLFSKSYTITKEAHFGKAITKNIKSTKEGQNVESEFGLDWTTFKFNTSIKTTSNAWRYWNPCKYL